MAVAGKVAWADQLFHSSPISAIASPVLHADKVKELLELTNLLHGRELTRKDRRIPSGLRPVDDLIGGGIVRGRISEIIAEPGAGKTSLAAAFAANVTRCEAAAWIDTADDFDPASIAAAGVELTRLLWVSSKGGVGMPPPLAGTYSSRAARSAVVISLKAAEWLLAVGGFGLVILDFGAGSPQLPQSAALRLARAAERSGAGVLVLAPRRMCGTFAALSLTLRHEQSCFSRLWSDAPVLFDGLRLAACVTRNKLGGSGRTAKWQSVTEDPAGGSGQNGPENQSQTSISFSSSTASPGAPQGHQGNDRRTLIRKVRINNQGGMPSPTAVLKP